MNPLVDKPCSIYHVIHRETGHDYIGISTRHVHRWFTHRWEARNGSDLPFHRALRAYGPEAFDWQVVHICSSFNTAKTIEIAARTLGLGYYNLTRGGDGILGFSHTEETKRKIGEANKGNKAFTGRRHTEQAKKNMSAAQKGRIITPEHRAKLSEARKGKCLGPRDPEVGRKISAAKTGKKVPNKWLGRKHTEASKQKIRDTKKRNRENADQNNLHRRQVHEPSSISDGSVHKLR